MINAGQMLRRLLGGEEVPERRLHARVILRWQRASRRGKPVPLSAFDYAAMEDESNHGFLLRIADGAPPELVYVGPVLRDEAAMHEDSAPLDRVEESSLLSRFGGRYREAVDTAAPVAAEYEFETPAGYRVFCRGALVPLSSNGQTIDHVYGAVSWKSEQVGPRRQLVSASEDRD